LCDDGAFATPDGRARFKAIAVPTSAVVEADSGCGTSGQCPSSEPHRFMVSTRRGKQFNSLIYAEIDPLTGAPRDAVFMSDEDADRMGLVTGDRVRLKNVTGHYDGSVFIAPIASGNLQIHWPEGNVLLRGGLTDPNSGVPDYNAWASVERAPR
jgi:anaerobic selenocysteine-containing dehydrogenase